MASEEESIVSVARRLAEVWESDDRDDTTVVNFYLSLMIRSLILRTKYSEIIAGVLLKTVADTGDEGRKFSQEIVRSAHDHIKAAMIKTTDRAGAGQYIASLKAQGEEVGFLHGKHRHLEVNQVAALILAAQQAHLVLGIESGERVRRYTGQEPPLPDETRLKLYAGLPMTVVVFLIEGGRVDNEYFRELVRELKPTVYFSGEEYSPEMQRERELRVGMIGAKLVTLPHLPYLGHSSAFDVLWRKKGKS